MCSSTAVEAQKMKPLWHLKLEGGKTIHMYVHTYVTGTTWSRLWLWLQMCFCCCCCCFFTLSTRVCQVENLFEFFLWPRQRQGRSCIYCHCCCCCCCCCGCCVKSALRFHLPTFRFNFNTIYIYFWSVGEFPQITDWRVFK